MWSGGSERCNVYLGNAIVGVSYVNGEVRWTDAASEQEAWAHALQLLQASGRSSWSFPIGRRKLSVWLSGALARPFMIGPLAGLKRWAEVLRVAEGLASDATGLAGPCVAWMDQWTTGRANLALAMNSALRDEIEKGAKAAGLHLVAIRPWWASALNTVFSDTAVPRLISVEDTDALTLLTGSEGQFLSAVTYAPRPAADQTKALMARAMLSAEIDSNQTAHLKLVRDSAPDGQLRGDLPAVFGVQRELYA